MTHPFRTKIRGSLALPPGGAGLVLVLLLLACLPSAAQENDDCMMCHEDPDLTGTRAGREISVYVRTSALARSVHADLDCVMCHQDLADAELPHAEDVEAVECGFCHEDRATEHDRSLHGEAAARGDKLAPSCTHCHGTHDILSHTDPDSPTTIMGIPLLCGRCHHEGTPVSLTHDIPQDRILENYSLSIHGKGLFQSGLTVTAVCTSCHTSHNILPHTDSRSSIHPRNVAKTCTKCHSQIERVHRKVIEGRLWEEEPHKIPACVDCHSPHKVRRVFYPAGMANKDCLTCHDRLDLTMERDGETISLYVDEQAHNASSHSGVACAQCHTEATSSRTRPCETIRNPVDCAVCHAEMVNEYRGSTHGTLHAGGDPDAPTCLDCHQKHQILSKRVPASPTFPQNVPMLCSRCHRAGEKAAVRIHAEVEDIVSSYVDSIHGKGLLKSGLVVTATCADCHTAHGELPPDDPRSSVHVDNIDDTCGQCHHGIEEVFKTSIHWRENVETDKKLPTCKFCHTSHEIRRVDAPGGRLARMQRCGLCHETEAVTFFDTYHGKVSQLGSEAAAKCSDCHGAHEVLPTSDPRSLLSLRNVVETCAKCHPGAHRRFAGYLTHATHHDAEKYPYLFWAYWGMTALLVGTLTVAVLHTLAWLIRLWLTRDQWKRHKAAPGEKLYRRFTRLQRTMHLLMLISFFTLALTGMALKFSYTGWALFISRILGGFDAMGVLHRTGAILLFGIFIAHLIDVYRKKKDENLSWRETIFNPDSILFNLADVKEFWGSLKWFLGLGPRPSYGRYTYWEKFDYFAVFWGIAVIGNTGLILWFPELFTYVIPGWFINVATIIHSDEALLAVGFIFTIHFFNTHFRPDKFPMDPVIFTGRVPLEELKHDKPREYERMVASGELEKHLVDPFPPAVERGFKIFGFVALTVGLLLIGLIVYAVLFGYR